MEKILIPENVVRKLDNLGRITLPKGLRDRMYLEEGSDLEIFTANIEGKNCICFAKPATREDELREARAIFEKYGIVVEETEEDAI